MDNLDLPQEDMEFLESISGPDRDPALQQHLDSLQQAAETGNEYARQTVEMLLVAESIVDEFSAVQQQMMNDSIGVCECILPELITLARIDTVFMGRLANALQAIQRSAFAHGWIARDRKESET